MIPLKWPPGKGKTVGKETDWWLRWTGGGKGIDDKGAAWKNFFRCLECSMHPLGWILLYVKKRGGVNFAAWKSYLNKPDLKNPLSPKVFEHSLQSWEMRCLRPTEKETRVHDRYWPVGGAVGSSHSPTQPLGRTDLVGQVPRQWLAPPQWVELAQALKGTRPSSPPFSLTLAQEVTSSPSKKVGESALGYLPSKPWCKFSFLLALVLSSGFPDMLTL